MLRKFVFAAAMVATVPAAAQPTPVVPHPEGPETGIPYVRTNGIVDFRANGTRGVFIRGITGRWYHARTVNECGRLRSANALGYQTFGPDRLDRRGTLFVDGWRCPLESVVESPPPPPRRPAF